MARPTLQRISKAAVAALLVMVGATAGDPVCAAPAAAQLSYTTVLPDTRPPVGVDALTCSDDVTCFVADTHPFMSRDGGAVWLPLPTEPMADISCPSTTLCVAVSSFGIRHSEDNGRTWSETDWYSSGNWIVRGTAIDCSTAGLCIALGVDPFTHADLAVRTNDGGRTIQPLALPAGAGELHDVACVTDGSCMITTSTGSLRTDDAGASWRKMSFNRSLGKLECATADRCLAVWANSPSGSGLASTVGANGAWAAIDTPQQPVDISCSDADTCAVVGSWPDTDFEYFAQYRFSTRSLAGAAVAAPGVHALRVDCRPSRCVVMGLGGGVLHPRAMESRDGGLTWTSVVTPTTRENRGLACPTAAVCYVGGRQIDPAGIPSGFVSRTIDGGASWTTSVVAGSLQVDALECPTANTCIAAGMLSSSTFYAGDGLFATSDGGGSWQAAAIPDNVVSVGDLHCPDSSRCLATATIDIGVGSPAKRPATLVSGDGGHTWAVTDVFSEQGVWGLICQQSVCGLRSSSAFQPTRYWSSTDLGATWTEQPADALATWCGPTKCFRTRWGALTELGGIWRGDGPLGPWTHQTDSIDYVGACHGATCLALSGVDGRASQVSYDDGDHWRAGERPADVGHVHQATCPSPTTCYIAAETTGSLWSVVRVDLGPQPAFHALSPARLVDTRPRPDGQTIDGENSAGGVIPAGGTLAVRVAGRAQIPGTAAAVALNVAVTQPAGAGFLTVFPCGQTRPAAANLNYLTGQTIANNVTAALGSGGAVCVFSSAAAHVVIDRTGYWAGGGGYAALSPARLLDTRPAPDGATIDGVGARSGRLGDKETRSLQVTGRGGVPGGATAAVLNVAVTQTGAPGFLTVYPCDSPRPNASSLNFNAAGVTVANNVYVALSASGTVCLHASSSTHVVVDVQGALSPPGEFAALNPARLSESRTAADLGTIDGQEVAWGPLRAGQTAGVRVAGRGGVSPFATGATLIVTAVNPQAPGYLTVWPCDRERPTAANVTYAAGQTIPNTVLAALGRFGDVCVFSSAATDLVVDVGGAFP